MLLPLQGATAPTRDTQGVGTLALGYARRWAPRRDSRIHAYDTQGVRVRT